MFLKEAKQGSEEKEMFSGLVFAEKERSELDQQLWRVNFLPVQLAQMILKSFLLEMHN